MCCVDSGWAMSDLTEQIAEVIRKHRYLALKGYGECACGHNADTAKSSGHAEHVASEVVAALGLHQETMHAPGQPEFVHTRWVTGWRPA